jgi:hypothetical protein
MSKVEELLTDLQERVKGLEQQAELIKTVLIVKEPNTVQASQAYDGLRKQVVASAAERRSHLAQLVSMAVAVTRASSVADLVPQVREWMEQAGVSGVVEVPDGDDPSHWFEDISGDGLDGSLQVVEPAFIDIETGSILRLGRARLTGSDDEPSGPRPARPASKRATGANETNEDVTA